MQLFEYLIPPTQSYNEVLSEVQVIDFQKIPVALSECGAIAIGMDF